MPGNVPTLAGRHGVDGVAPVYEDEAWGDLSHKTNLELCDLLEAEIGKIISRCNVGFCGSPALKIRTVKNGESYTPLFLFCPNCHATYFSLALFDLIPLLEVLGVRNKSSDEERDRVKSLWFPR